MFSVRSRIGFSPEQSGEVFLWVLCMDAMLIFADALFQFVFYVPFHWTFDISYILSFPAWLLLMVMVIGSFIKLFRRF